MTQNYDGYNATAPGGSGKVQTGSALSGGNNVSVTIAGGGTTLQNGSTFTITGSATVYTYYGYVVDGTQAIIVASYTSGGTTNFVEFYPHGAATLNGNQPVVVATSSQSTWYDTNTGTIECFLEGTRILTPDGEVAVENLKRGDLVLTLDGKAKPVLWLGKQTVSTVFADPLRVMPIRIRAGALGENIPSRDLLVSPDHALFVGGQLVQAGALVNGTSIVRDERIDEILVYYHVELDEHSLIIAENAPAETFVDNVDRLGFANWSEYQALYPQGKAVQELALPRAKTRRQIPIRIRALLDARAEAIGATAAAVA